MNSIERLREALPVLRDHARRGNYDALEVELAQLTFFQRQLLGAQLCLKIAWSYPRRWLSYAGYGIRSSKILLQWAMFRSWLHVRRTNFAFLTFNAAGWRGRPSVGGALKEWCSATLQHTRNVCYEMLRYAIKCYRELTFGTGAGQRTTVSGAVEAGQLENPPGRPIRRRK